MRGCRSVGVGKSPDPGNASRQLQDTPIVNLVQHRSPNFDPGVWLRGPVNPIYREGRGEAIWFPVAPDVEAGLVGSLAGHARWECSVSGPSAVLKKAERVPYATRPPR